MVVEHLNGDLWALILHKLTDSPVKLCQVAKASKVLKAQVEGASEVRCREKGITVREHDCWRKALAELGVHGADMELGFFADNMAAIHSVIVLGNTNLIASAGDDEQLRIWNSQTGELHHVLTQNTFCLASLDKGSRFVTGHHDQALRIWDSYTGKCEKTMRGHTGAIDCLMALSHGSRVVSGRSIIPTPNPNPNFTIELRQTAHA